MTEAIRPEYQGSPGRSWQVVDEQDLLELPILNGPEGPFFVSEHAAQPDEAQLNLLGKTEQPAEGRVLALMTHLGLLDHAPQTPGEQTRYEKIITTVEAMGRYYKTHYLSHMGYEGPGFRTKLAELRRATSAHNNVPLVAYAQKLESRYRDRTNTDTEALVRLLVQYEMQQTSQ